MLVRPPTRAKGPSERCKSCTNARSRSSSKRLNSFSPADGPCGISNHALQQTQSSVPGKMHTLTRRHERRRPTRALRSVTGRRCCKSYCRCQSSQQVRHIHSHLLAEQLKISCRIRSCCCYTSVICCNPSSRFDRVPWKCYKPSRCFETLVAFATPDGNKRFVTTEFACRS